MKYLWRLRHFLLPYRWQFAGAVITLLGVTATQLLVPGIIRQVVDIGLAQGETLYLGQAALTILGIGVLGALLSSAQRYMSEFISMRVSYDLRNRLYNHIQQLSFSYHDRSQTGQLISRCIEDVRSVQQFIGTGFAELLGIFLMMVGTISVMFISNSKLAAISMIPILILGLITTDFGSRVSKLFYNIDKALGDLSARLQENVSGVQVVRAFTREPYEINRFDRSNRELFDARVTVISEWSKIMPTSNFLIAASTILILWFGGQMALEGILTVGQVVAFNSYVLLLALPAQRLTWFVNSAGEAAAGVQRVFEVLDQEPEIRSPDSPLNEKIRGEVTFKDVHFTYQGEPQPALQAIDFEVQPNQVIGLIGPTGSGKTTLVNLISRFYDVSEGQVLIDGHDVRDFDLQELRRQIGIVMQSTLLFSASIHENIAYGQPEASREDVIAAAKAAQVHTFIEKMPEGYDTIIGERGITLSGGQRQRVAIARALLLDPNILILDDATSSVDPETEHAIQLELKTLMEGRTTFVIAQRLSTVRDADVILVLDEGRVIESGDHDSLLEHDGLYNEIYDLQLAQRESFQQELKELDEKGEE